MKHRFWISALALLLALTGCKPELDFLEGSLRPGRAEALLSGGNVSLNFPAEAGSASVDLSASGAWTAAFVNDRAKDWCTLSTSEGKRGTATISVSVKENTDFDDRSATISFTCGDLKRTINVTQKQKDALLVTGNRFDVGQDGGRISVEVKANIVFEYTVSQNAKDWIVPAGTKGLTTSALNFNVLANDSVVKREGEITVTSAAGSETVKVYQEGATPTIVLSKNRYDVPAAGGQARVDVQSNIDVAMELPSDCGWVRENPTQSLSTNTFFLAVDENETFVARECRILFKAAAWGLEEEVVIHQAAAQPQIIVGTGEYSFSCEGGDLSIDVQSNFGITAVVPDDIDWIQMVGTKALTTKSFLFTVSPNELFVPREGRILFTNESLGITETVVVRQQPDEPQIIIAGGYYAVDAEGGDISVELQTNVGITVVVPDTCAWIKAVKTKAMTKKVFQFTVEPNDTFSERQGVILFTDEERGITEKVIVDQKQNDGVFVSNKDFDLAAEGGTFEVKVRYNAEYSLYVEPNWVHELETKAMTTDVHRFAVDTNLWPYQREGYVYVFHQGVTDTVVVRQDCLTQYIKVVSPESRELSWEGGTLEVLLEHTPYGFRSNQAYFINMGEVSFGDDYVFAGVARSFKEVDIRHSLAMCPYTKNPLRRERKGYMLLYNYGFTTRDTVWFYQPPVTILTSGTGVTLPQSAGTFSFRVAGTDPGLYSVESYPSWVEQTGVAVKNGELEYSWKSAANTGRAMREGIIKIYRKDGGWPDEFLVRQEGAGLSVSVSFTGQRAQAPVIHGKYWNESVIDWGDGSSQNYVEKAKHSYASFRAYTITVTSRRMEYFDWAEVSTFQNGMLIDFSKMH